MEKINKTLHQCRDQGLNKILFKNKYPLHNSTSTIGTLHQVNHQIISEHCPSPWEQCLHFIGAFGYLVMPFGLTNAPPVFQAYIVLQLLPTTWPKGLALFTWPPSTGRLLESISQVHCSILDWQSHKSFCGEAQTALIFTHSLSLPRLLTEVSYHQSIMPFSWTLSTHVTHFWPFFTYFNKLQISSAFQF